MKCAACCPPRKRQPSTSTVDHCPFLLVNVYHPAFFYLVDIYHCLFLLVGVDHPALFYLVDAVDDHLSALFITPKTNSSLVPYDQVL